MSTLTNISRGKAYKEAKAKQPSVKDRIIATLSEFSYCSRRHLHQQTGIEIATLCGALSSLMKAGKIREAFNHQCETTGKEVVVYALNTSEVE